VKTNKSVKNSKFNDANCDFYHFHPKANDLYLILRIVLNKIFIHGGGICMFLSNLVKGNHGKIIEIVHHNDNLKRRMTDLGVVEGAEVSLKGIMPFGGPIMIEVGGHLITIRRKDAASIEVGF
jgi:ferrous iron transport protein A